MTYVRSTLGTGQIKKDKYQPTYPLVYDASSGPYQSVDSLEMSIKADFENLLLTSPGEWPMDPQLGVGIKRFLFDNFGNFDAAGLQSVINHQISKYLGSVKLLKLEVSKDSELEDLNTVAIKIVYSILGSVIINSVIGTTASGGVNIDIVSMDKYSPSFRDRRHENLPSNLTEV